MTGPDIFAGILRGRVIGAEGGLVYGLVGEIDHSSAGPLVDRLMEVARDHADVVDLEMSEVGFLDSAGLRALHLIASELQARGGRLRLMHPSPPVLRVLELTHAELLVVIDDERPENPSAA